MEKLKGKCKKALEEGKCLGCVGLAEEDWQEPKECEYIKEAEQLKIGGEK